MTMLPQSRVNYADVPPRGLTLWDVRRKIIDINPTKEIVMNTKRFMLHSQDY